MGKLADELARRGEPTKGQRCYVAQLRSRLDPDLLADLDAALADHNVGHQQLCDALTALEVPNPPQASSISRHRRGQCKCGEHG